MGIVWLWRVKVLLVELGWVWVVNNTLGCHGELCLDSWVWVFWWGGRFVSVVWLWRAVVLVVTLGGLGCQWDLMCGFMGLGFVGSCFGWYPDPKLRKDLGPLKMGVWLLVWLNLTHCDLMGPFYEPICAQDMNPTSQTHIYIYIYKHIYIYIYLCVHVYILVEWMSKERQIKWKKCK